LPEKTPAKNLNAVAANAYQSWEKKTAAPAEREHRPEPQAARDLLRESTIQADTDSRSARGDDAKSSAANSLPQKPSKHSA
jgi:hypothetical protein